MQIDLCWCDVKEKSGSMSEGCAPSHSEQDKRHCYGCHNFGVGLLALPETVRNCCKKMIMRKITESLKWRFMRGGELMFPSHEKVAKHVLLKMSNYSVFVYHYLGEIFD